MFADSRVGSLIEPLTGRAWDGRAIMDRYHRRLAHYAALGLTRSDRVFLHYGNTPEFFVDLLAIWDLGGCAVPIDSQLTLSEVEILARVATPRCSIWKKTPDAATSSCLSNLGIQVLTVPGVNEGAACASRLAPSGGPALDEDALILFTSGTTGQPKGVVHTHRSLRARWMSLRDCLGLDAFRRTLCVLPTHFGHGLICNCLFPWLSGQDLYILPPFRLDLLGQLGLILEEHDITFVSSVPALWRLALKTARPPRSRTLNQVFCGSAPLSAALWSSIREWTGGAEVRNVYGITETGSWLAGTPVPGVPPEDGLIGVAWGGVVKVLRTGSTRTPPALAEECAHSELGFVWANTPALMRGYIGRADLTAEVVTQGWFLTGDIGFIDDRGLLYLKGREREEINKGGMKVYPDDIDAIVERLGEAIDACSFGYADPLYGENVGIAVVLNSGDEGSLHRLHDWMSRHLAKHRIPQRWYVIDEIPRTSSGKVRRAAVAERCANLEPVKMPKLPRTDHRPGSGPSGSP